MKNKKISSPAIVFMIILTVFISGCALADTVAKPGHTDNGAPVNVNTQSPEILSEDEVCIQIPAEETEAPSVTDYGEPALDITLEENRIIQDQSFNVELNDWGNVRFISYAPDYSVDFEDVSFYLMNDTNVIYSFPYYYENNNSSNVGLFDSVAAVAFCDVNNDTIKDVIIIINYITGAGPQGMIPRPRARIYLANKKSFDLATELIDDITNNIEENDLTIATICEYLKNK
jgi:hypothetical protein